MRNALLTGVLASIICGLIGVYIVLKKIVFISGGISHISMGGIGLGYYLGVDPMLVTLPFTIAAALLIGVIKKNIKVYEDTAIGILWALGMALGVIFINLSRGYAPDLFSYLFGNILSVTRQDLLLIAVLSGIVILIVIVFNKEFLMFAFDEEFAEISGVPVKLFYFLFLGLIAITVVTLMKIVGIILVMAFLTLPVATAGLFSAGVKQMMRYAIFFGIVSVLLGLYLSFQFNLASGATIVMTSGVLFALAALGKGFREQRRARRRMA